MAAVPAVLDLIAGAIKKRFPCYVCVCVCVCVCVSIYIMCLCVFVFVWVCIHVYVCVYMYAYTYIGSPLECWGRFLMVL